MGTQTWSGLDTPASFSQALDKVTTGTADEALTSEAQTFMMLFSRLMLYPAASFSPWAFCL
jgi:hypothetical protein